MSANADQENSEYGHFLRSEKDLTHFSLVLQSKSNDWFLYKMQHWFIWFNWHIHYVKYRNFI